MNRRSATGVSLSFPSLRPRLPRWLPFAVPALAMLVIAALAFTSRASTTIPSSGPSARRGDGVSRSDAGVVNGADRRAGAVPTVTVSAGRSVPTTIGGMLDLPAVERVELPPASPSGNPAGSTTVNSETDRPPCRAWVLIGRWFAADDASPHPDAWPLLDNMAAELLTYGGPVTIVGHTDVRETDFVGGNQGLSVARAEGVRGELVARGVDIRRIAVSGSGAADLIDREGTEVAHQLNRRVTVAPLCENPK